MLDALKLPPEERQSRIEMQKKIQAAVISGTGWDGVPPAMRRQADTPWFKSVLTFDPAQVVARVKQPILILHGELDPNIPPSEADRLAAIAKARKKSGAARSRQVPGRHACARRAGRQDDQPRRRLRDRGVDEKGLRG